MSKMLRIGWLGGGKMAQALAKGIVSTGVVSITLFHHFIVTFLLSRIDKK
jgi:pyrroline-5-carboxylate reductase